MVFFQQLVFLNGFFNGLMVFFSTARAGAVNYHWRRVGEDDSLWRPLFIRDFKMPKTAKLKVRKLFFICHTKVLY